jgi:hypothetical protein
MCVCAHISSFDKYDDKKVGKKTMKDLSKGLILEVKTNLSCIHIEVKKIVLIKYLFFVFRFYKFFLSNWPKIYTKTSIFLLIL